MPTVDVSRIASSIGVLSTIYTSQTLNTALATHQSRLSGGSRLMAAADDVSISSSGAARQQALKDSLASLGDTSTAHIDTATSRLEAGRSEIGTPSLERLTSEEEALATRQLNAEAAYNRIMNANMAEEALNASRFTILQQTSTAMLAQANVAPQALMQLFR